MAKPDHSIDPRILESAKQEFLANGFEKASLKTICDNAEITTGALYKRYKGKEDLFCAVAADTVSRLNEFVAQKCAIDPNDLPDDALIKAWEMEEDVMMGWFRFLYECRDGFVLLIKYADGTAYSNFQHDWVEKMTEETYDYFLVAKKRGLTCTSISKEAMHILLSAFWTTIYEPFIHNYTWEQIESHSKLVCDLFNWQRVLGFIALT
jgi:AcrR family transcriptional regulator